MEKWRESLGIENPRWQKIAQHLAEITNRYLTKSGKTICDLTNHLRDAGNKYIEPRFVEEYLTGNTSFGCFFQQYQEFLGINPSDIFPNAQKEEVQEHLAKLIKYLGATNNLEFLVSYMIHKPGEELRNHVRNLVKEKIEKVRVPPYFSVEVGLNEDDYTNPYKKGQRDLMNLLKNKTPWLHSIANSRLSLSENNIPSKNPQNPITALTIKDIPEFYREVAEIFNKVANERGHSYFGCKVKEGTKIVIQPALLRNKQGYSVDFYENTSVEEMLCGLNRDTRFTDYFISQKALKEILEKGTFTEFQDMDKLQSLINFIEMLDSDMTELIPHRELREAEQFEFHQRWIWAGGWFMPGPHVNGPSEIEGQMKRRKDPVGRTEFEETAYHINSSLLKSLNLFDEIYKLTSDGEIEFIVD
jgi:hypothetical protein